MDASAQRQWIVLLAVVCLLVGWNYWLDRFFFSTPFAVYGSGFGDFEIYRVAAASWLSHGNPYMDSPGFIYPPTSLPFFALYAMLPFHLAGQVWWITYFVFFVAVSISLCLTLKNGNRRLLFGTILTLFFFTSYPLLALFQLGQADLLAEALAVFALVLERSRHKFESAAILSFSVLLKGPAVLLLAYFVLFRKDFSYLLRFLVSALAIVGVSMLVVPMSDYWYYLTRVLPTFSIINNANSNQSVGGLMSAAKFGPVTSIISFGGYVVFALFSYWAGARRLPFNLENFSADAMFLMNVLIMLLFDPRATIYPYVWVILPLPLFLSAILVERVRSVFLAVLGFGAFLLNSTLVPSSLNYQVLPLEVIGNMISCSSLVLLYVHPSVAYWKKPGIEEERLR